MTHSVYEALRYLTAALCAYEAAAIVIRNERAPTFSMLAGRHRWLAPVLVGALTVHLIWPIPEAT